MNDIDYLIIKIKEFIGNDKIDLHKLEQLIIDNNKGNLHK